MAGRYPENVSTPNFGGTGKTEQQYKQESDDLKPNNLDDEETIIWDRVCVELIKEDRMKPLFVDALQQYCYVLNQINKLGEELKKESTYWSYGRNGDQEKNKPQLAQRNEYFRQWNTLVAQFGLSAGTEKRFINNQLGLPGMSSHDNSGWGSFPDA